MQSAKSVEATSPDESLLSASMTQQNDREVFDKMYLSQDVVNALQKSRIARKSYKEALKNLRKVRQDEEKSLRRQEAESNKQLQQILAQFEAKQAEMRRARNKNVLSTEQGLAERLRLGEKIPYLSKKYVNSLRKQDQDDKTVRFFALAQSLLKYSKPLTEPDMAGAAALMGRGSASATDDLTASSSDEASQMVQELQKRTASALLSRSEASSTLSQSEKDTILAFQEELSERLAVFYTNAQKYVAAAAQVEDSRKSLQSLTHSIRLVSRTLRHLKKKPAQNRVAIEQLERQMATFQEAKQVTKEYASDAVLAAGFEELQSNALEIATLVRREHQVALEQIVDRLSAALIKQINDDNALLENERKTVQDQLDKLEQAVRATKERANTARQEAEERVGALEQTLENALQNYEQTIDELENMDDLDTDYRQWPDNLAAQDAENVRNAIEMALRELDVPVMKLEDAKKDEINEATGKHITCVPPYEASPYQQALTKYVNDGFDRLPGVLVTWQPGTGKTRGSMMASVEMLHRRFVRQSLQQQIEKSTKRGRGRAKKTTQQVDLLVLGFVLNNLQDFYETFFSELETRFEDAEYEVIKESGKIENNLRVHIRIRSQRDDTENIAVVVFQRYSVMAGEAAKMKMHPDGFVVLDEAHFLSTRSVPTNSNNRRQVLAAQDAWEKFVKDFDGMRLLLTATPSGSQKDPTDMLQLLAYLPRQRLNSAEKRSAANRDDRDVEAHQNWFDEKPDGSVAWRPGAREEFERDWLRGKVSFVSLRFDKRVFPQVVSRCGQVNNEKQCIYELSQSADNAKMQLAPDLPNLSAADKRARQLLDYGRMAPMLVRTPLRADELKGLKTKFTTTSVNTRNPELFKCMTIANKPVSQWSDQEIAECAAYAHYAGRKARGKWASGGGFDMDSKLDGVMEVMDAVTKERGQTRHIIVASGYEHASARNFQTPLKRKLEAAKFKHVVKKDVDSDAAADKLRQNAQQRFAFLTGKSFTGSGGSVKTPTHKQRMKDLFFSDANRDGSIIQVLVVDASMLTGFDGRGATHLHLVSPVLNQEQAWSRILRRCAQPVDKSMVYVYTYQSYIPSDLQQANKLYITPDEFVLEHLKRERQITRPVDLMREAMREFAYDAYFFGAYSSGGLRGGNSGDESLQEMPVEPMDRTDYVIMQTLLKVQPAKSASQEEQSAVNVSSSKQKANSDALSAEGKGVAEFAERFFVQNPWSKVAIRGELEKLDALQISDAKMSEAKVILDAVRTVAGMSQFIDFALLEAFLTEKLSQNKRNALEKLLLRKMARTSGAFLETFKQFYLLQKEANSHYRVAVRARVDLTSEHQAQRDKLVETGRQLAKKLSLTNDNTEEQPDNDVEYSRSFKESQIAQEDSVSKDFRDVSVENASAVAAGDSQVQPNAMDTPAGSPSSDFTSTQIVESETTGPLIDTNSETVPIADSNKSDTTSSLVDIVVSNEANSAQPPASSSSITSPVDSNATTKSSIASSIPPPVGPSPAKPLVPPPLTSSVESPDYPAGAEVITISSDSSNTGKNTQKSDSVVSVSDTQKSDSVVSVGENQSDQKSASEKRSTTKSAAKMQNLGFSFGANGLQFTPPSGQQTSLDDVAKIDEAMQKNLGIKLTDEDVLNKIVTDGTTSSTQ